MEWANGKRERYKISKEGIEEFVLAFGLLIGNLTKTTGNYSWNCDAKYEYIVEGKILFRLYNDGDIFINVLIPMYEPLVNLIWEYN